MRATANLSILAGVLLVSAAPAHAQGGDAAAAGHSAGAAPAPGGGDQAAIPTRSMVLHVPPSEAAGGTELRLKAVVDAAWTEAALVVKYRPLGSDGGYADSLFQRSSAGGYYALIPADAVRRPGLEYFIAGQLADGTEILHFGSPVQPHQVLVQPRLSVRWAEKERMRLRGYLSTVGADVSGHDFGNRYGNTDQFWRFELDWTHRLLGALYSISFGYGAMEGETPNQTGSMAMSTPQGLRYGYGGLRLKAAASIWLDGRVIIGVDRQGFMAGAGGALTLGKPWRSNISIGGEVVSSIYASESSGRVPTLWFRLQWDTVPPFLMGATIFKTDLPGAVLDDGSYIMYDLSYPATPRLTVRGSVSFGNRDGPGNFGGGLGATLAF